MSEIKHEASSNSGQGLWSPFTIRGTTLKNRLVVSPMCQYTAIDGYVQPYHLVHYGRFALGGFGLVMVEATGVSPEGRISHGDLGIWDDSHIEGLSQIASFLKEYGSVPAIQIAHAGRKASCQRPFEGDGPLTDADAARGDAPWPVVAANDTAFSEGWAVPTQLDAAGLAKVKHDFLEAARRSLAAGFEVLELHCAHGYLMNSFLSPLTNKRQDGYGGDLKGRMRLPLEVARELREFWPEDLPVFVRISAIDGLPGGTTIEDSVEFAKELAKIGIDVVDCSSGGIAKGYSGPTGMGYQVGFSRQIRQEADIATMAVGLIVDAHQADAVVQNGGEDLVAIAREALRDPNFAFHAQEELGVASPESPYGDWPIQQAFWLNGRQKQMDRLAENRPKGG